MRVLVCGSRYFNDAIKLDEVLSQYVITEVIEGEAPGADRLARDWAISKGIPVQKFPANWKMHGKGAGPIRNAQMLVEGKPQFIIAFLAPGSRGTKDMIRKAVTAKVDHLVIHVGRF